MSEKQPDSASGDNYPTRFPSAAEASAPETIGVVPVARTPSPLGETLASPGGIAFPSEPPSARGYELLGELGRGGMGIVYRAKQTALNRQVALKMILAGEYAKPEEVQRFRAEAEAVAQLEHPNIIHIYDVGEQDGRPYFAMELANAGCLADRLGGKPIPFREAAGLIETLARAMHHAHQRGIVHRDLKPANILLASGSSHDLGSAMVPLAESVPKITDFGLAKRMDSHGRTVSGRVIGTVNYMAPEQAEGRSRAVGPATDVYGLGAILYELLTGGPPFQADSLLATLEMVRHIEPKPIREANPTCPRDLETICLKCLEKEPGRRYASGLELAEDLARFLNHESIHARPVSAWERGWRFLARHRRAALVSGAAALTLGLLAFFLFRQVFERQRERQQARNDFQEAVTGLDNVRERIADPHCPAALFESALQELPRYYQQIQQRIDDDDLTADAARACAALAEQLWELGRKDEASEACKTTIRLLGTTLDGNPQDNTARSTLARMRLRLGEILSTFRDYAAADREFKEAIADLARLVERNTDDRDYQRALAEGYHQLGVLQDARKKRAAAVEAYRESLKIREKLVKSEPSNRGYRRDLARSHGYLGDTYLEMGDDRQAWKAYEEAEKIRQALVDEDPKPEARFQLARSHANEGNFGLWMDEPEQALRGYTRAREIQEKLVQELPRHEEYKGDLGWSLINMAELLIERNGPAEQIASLLRQAEKLFLEASSTSKDAGDARNLARTYITGAQAVIKKDTREAASLLKKARAVLESLSRREQAESRVDPEDLYQLARLEALEGSLLPEDETRERRAHANRAMNHLAVAVRAGYAKPARLKCGAAGLDLPWAIDAERMEDLRQQCRPGKP